MRQSAGAPKLVVAALVALLLAACTPAAERSGEAAPLEDTAASPRAALTTDPAEDREPAWSPDGSRIAFSSERDGNFEIYSVAADGGDLRRHTINDGQDSSPSWSPDGSRIAFQSEREGGTGIWILDVPSGETTFLLADASPELTIDWAPDGEWIAFTSRRTGNADLWVVSASGGEPQQLTSNEYRDVWPRWSPDGGQLLFFSRRDTGGDWDQLYTLDWTTREVQRVTVQPTHHHFAPDWAPDGARVVTGLSDRVADRALAIFAIDGSLERRFAEGFYRVFQPAWSPDGTRIAFAARVAPEGADIYVEDLPAENR